MNLDHLMVALVACLSTLLLSRQLGCFVRLLLLTVLLIIIAIVTLTQIFSLNANSETAKASHVDLIEFDLSLTKDGIAVLMHDDDLMRTCGEPGLIGTLTLDELKKKNAGNGFHSERTFENNGNQLNVIGQDAKTIKKFHRIPTLVETVDYCSQNNIKMLFDVKDGSETMVAQIVSVIAQNNLYDKVIVSSFFPWVSYAVKKTDPRILTGITWRPYFFSYSDIENRVPRFIGIKHYIALLLDRINVKLLTTYLPSFLGVEMLLTNEMDINRQLVDSMNKSHIRVVAWTVNDARQMLYYIDTLKVPVLSDVPHLFTDVKDIRMKLHNVS